MYFVHLLLIMGALTLFITTAVAGRMWCGYACPQTLMSESFIVVERWLEGDRAARMKLDKAPWTAAKVGRKLSKYAIWTAMALWLGITFVGYFHPIRTGVEGLLQGHVDYALLGPILFFAGAAYFDFGFFREQLCHYACPYARFQGAMFDRNTLLVGYDKSRGEPRSKAKRITTSTPGDCVDCTMCVQVCPMGIDIRNGLQLECIACTACVDACDTVMDKLKRPRGLIRYSSENALEGQKTSILRPRVAVYAALLLGLATLFGGLLWQRQVLALDVVRGVSDNVFGRTPEGDVMNSYVVKLINKDSTTHRIHLAVSGLDGARLLMPRNPMDLSENQASDIRVMVLHSPQQLPPLSHIDFVLTDDAQPGVAIHRASSFLGPGL
jgi:cytochrome c oxidase accessory protein FixG